jgi:hypothetical protein
MHFWRIAPRTPRTGATRSQRWCVSSVSEKRSARVPRDEKARIRKLGDRARNERYGALRLICTNSVK